MRPITIRATLLLVLLSFPAHPGWAQEREGKRDDAEALYALGLSLWRGLAALDLSPAECETLARGLRDAAAGKPEITPESVGPQLTALRKARAPRALEKEKARSAEYLAKAQVEAGADRTASGLVFFSVTPGTGEAPAPAATVKLHYRGTLADGSEFDRSAAPGVNLARVELADLIPCLREGVLRMKEGGKSRLVCPAEIAYGDRGRPSVPPGAAVVFDVELVEVVKTSPRPN
ncbi:MAG: FKBP-type peptidyl-prolyl cis-trans isomerase [Burkholderiales bacterium]|jgi:FKBP-type peptidyl-prolyl cis-trans isomerase FkpA